MVSAVHFNTSPTEKQTKLQDKLITNKNWAVTTRACISKSIEVDEKSFVESHEKS